MDDIGCGYKVSLAHSPSISNYIREHNLDYDLLLVGHTHGGQVRFFNKTIGANKNCHVGVKWQGKRLFFINRGLDVVKFPFRVNAFPEIVVFCVNP